MKLRSVSVMATVSKGLFHFLILPISIIKSGEPYPRAKDSPATLTVLSSTCTVIELGVVLAIEIILVLRKNNVF